MKLTKKKAKHYKPLIKAKLMEMGVKDQVGYTETGSFRTVSVINEEDKENPKVETKRVPSYRAVNLYKNLTKKLLGMSTEAIEKFLSSPIGNKTETQGVEDDQPSQS